MQSTRRPIDPLGSPIAVLKDQRTRLEKMMQEPYAPATLTCIAEAIEDIDYELEWRRIPKSTRSRLTKRGITPFNGRWNPSADES